MVYNSSKRLKEKFGQLLILEGKKQQPTEMAVAGDILAIPKLKETGTGDTLSAENEPIIYTPTSPLPPVISYAVEAKVKGSEDKLFSSFARLLEEDATLRLERDQATSEIVLSGTGQIHLEATCEKLARKFGVAVVLKPVKVPYRETIKKTAQGGMQTEAEMLHEHPLELADIKAGIADRRPDAATIRKRQTVYFPIAAILTLGMLGGIYGFINVEETALTTVPPQPDPIEIYVPQTMTPAATLTPTPNPTNTAVPNASLDSKVDAVVAQICNSCQSETGEDGLDLPAYEGASIAAQVER